MEYDPARSMNNCRPGNLKHAPIVRRALLLFTTLLVVVFQNPTIAAETASQQAFLKRFVETCTNKQWAACNLARYDLLKAGFRLDVSETGDPYLQPPTQNAAIRYFGVLDRITGENADLEDQEAFYGLVSPLSPTRGLPKKVAMFFEVRDRGMRGVGLMIIANNFTNANIHYDVMVEMESDRLEFIRQLALVYTVRNNQEEAKRALDILEKAVRTPVQRKDTKAVRKACLLYLAQRPRINTP